MWGIVLSVEQRHRIRLGSWTPCNPGRSVLTVPRFVASNVRRFWFGWVGLSSFDGSVFFPFGFEWVLVLSSVLQAQL